MTFGLVLPVLHFTTKPPALEASWYATERMLISRNPVLTITILVTLRHGDSSSCILYPLANDGLRKTTIMELG